MPPKVSQFVCLLVPLIQSTTGKTLWSTSPADARDIYRTTYPLGNGRLGAMPSGPAGAETLTLNLDSLWSGGPFNISVSPTLITSKVQAVLTLHVELYRRQPTHIDCLGASRHP